MARLPTKRRGVAAPAGAAELVPETFPVFPTHAVVAIGSLVPYPTNARTHSPEQVDKIARSIQEFGFTNPILIDGENGVLAGHGRLLAARQLGLGHVPVVQLSHLSEDQRRAYVLADNRLALDAGWDDGLLKLELGALAEAGYDLALTGFSLDDLQVLLHPEDGLVPPDDVPEVPAVITSRLDDVWLLGRHRLVCGSCTMPETVVAALGSAKPHLMVTDPPYGVNYDAAWRNRAGVGGAGSAVGKVMNDHRADWREAWELFPGAVAYVWHAGTHAAEVGASLEATRFRVRAQIVWVKSRLVLSRGDYHHQHEPAFFAVRDGVEDDHWQHFEPDHEVATYGVRAGAVGSYRGGRKQSTVWNIDHVKSETGHSTQKPVECMRRPIENNSRAGDAVYEPFSGSGTTIIAAEMTGRCCHAIELDPAYVDVAVLRWEAFTGKQATLGGGAKTFAEVAAARVKAANKKGKK